MRRTALAALSLAAATSFATPASAGACAVEVTCSYLNVVCVLTTGSPCL